MQARDLLQPQLAETTQIIDIAEIHGLFEEPEAGGF